MERASNALSASLYKSSVSMIDECFSSSASAATRSWCDVEARTMGFEDAGETYNRYATAEKFRGSR
jgi:hypothetical protein